MAHESLKHERPSTPQSFHDDPSYSEYTPSPAPAHPYTPPRSHPGQTYSYGDPEEYEMAQIPEYCEPTYYRTPPMPITSASMQTRSGRSVGSPMTPATSSPSSRMSRSPRQKKRKGRKQEDDLVIQEPLSVMTADYDVPVMDMMVWANRSNEDRYKEVEGKHKGKIPRPMNSFMLYRTAYKERIKKWGAQGDNNQLISKVAGSSWLLESEDLKEFYAKCANTERDNHAAAFPNYKFAPNKNPKKRNRDDDDDESDPEWDCSSVYSGKRRRGRHDRDVTRSRSTTPAQAGQYHQPSYHSSPYQASNSDPRMMQHMQAMGYYDQFGRPVMPHSQYYQTNVPTYSSYPQDFQYATTSVPAQTQYSTQLVGLPPAATDSFNGQYSSSHQDFAIDPGLDDFAQAIEYQYGSSTEGQHLQPQGHHEAVYEGEPETVVHPGMQMLAPAEAMWSPSGIRNEFDTELNRWHGGP